MCDSLKWGPCFMPSQSGMCSGAVVRHAGMEDSAVGDLRRQRHQVGVLGNSEISVGMFYKD